MKKWTVMLIPQESGGNTRTLNLWGYQFWFVVALVVGLSFSSAFFFKRHQVTTREFNRLKEAKQALELQRAEQPEPAPQTLSGKERLKFEQQVRTEYEASLSTITARLTDLYDLEHQARQLTGLGDNSARVGDGEGLDGGKGGGSDGLGDIAYEEQDVFANPAHVIYGLSRPSADLIIQEINLRTESLRVLIADLEVREDQVARIPAAWPVKDGRGRISSPFGYRKDPFTYRICHHNGMDISMRTGTPVVATARGIVTFCGRDGALGRTVRVEHGNGMVTCYAHLQKCLASVGDEVERLDAVGTLGSSGRTTGPHLHYEVRIHGKPVNPAKYIRD